MPALFRSLRSPSPCRKTGRFESPTNNSVPNKLFPEENNMNAYPKIIFSSVCSMLLSGSLLTTSCGSNHSAASNQLPAATAKPGVIVNQSKSESKTVTFEGVTVTYEESLKTSITADQTKDSPLANETDKPDSVSPGHVVFKFAGDYGEKFKNS